MRIVILMALSLCLLASCNEATDTSGAQLVFKFRFDPDQARLNNIGQPSVLPEGHAAQTPDFHGISAHYIELAPSAFTPLGAGTIVYQGAETTAGGGEAIDFSKSVVVDEGETFLSVPLSSVAPGNYQWVRVSLSYQNYTILVSGEVSGIAFEDVPATVASFVGYNSYIGTYTIDEAQITVNANKLQGYGAVETNWNVTQFQAPPGATTVPNPLFDSSPIPAGSCVLTGAFDETFTLTGEETEDVEVELSVSIDRSFEWEDDNGNDQFEPLAGESVVDMGLRGLIPSVQ